MLAEALRQRNVFLKALDVCEHIVCTTSGATRGKHCGHLLHAGLPPDQVGITQAARYLVLGFMRLACLLIGGTVQAIGDRSEERRVGKVCSAWARACDWIVDSTRAQ